MPPIQVFDHKNQPRSLEWLREKYGPFVIHQPPPLPEGETDTVWRVTTLREKVNAPASLIVQTIAEDGSLIPGVKVAWYWPDADPDTQAGPLGAPFDGVAPNRAVHGYTNANGDIGHPMGQGAYYWPNRGEKGPHATWIHGAETRSELVLGLGMEAGTNHNHFDVQYTSFEETGGENGSRAAVLGGNAIASDNSTAATTPETIFFICTSPLGRIQDGGFLLSMASSQRSPRSCPRCMPVADRHPS